MVGLAGWHTDFRCIRFSKKKHIFFQKKIMGSLIERKRMQVPYNAPPPFEHLFQEAASSAWADGKCDGEKRKNCREQYESSVSGVNNVDCNALSIVTDRVVVQN